MALGRATWAWVNILFGYLNPQQVKLSVEGSTATQHDSSVRCIKEGGLVHLLYFAEDPTLVLNGGGSKYSFKTPLVFDNF